jgi:hypothetical protein
MPVWLKIVVALVSILVVSVVVVAVLRWTELPAVADAGRIEALFPAELALLAELAVALPAESAGSGLDLARIDEADPEARDAARRQLDLYEDLQRRGAGLDHPAILRASARVYETGLNRIVILFRDDVEPTPEWDWEDRRPEVGRPVVSLVFAASPVRRLVRYAAKIGEAEGVSRGYEVVFDLEALQALDAAERASR